MEPSELEEQQDETVQKSKLTVSRFDNAKSQGASKYLRHTSIITENTQPVLYG